MDIVSHDNVQEIEIPKKVKLLTKMFFKTLELKRLARDSGQVPDGLHCVDEASRAVKGHAH